MRLDDEQESSNYEDHTGRGGGGGFGFPMGGGGGGLPVGGRMGCGTLLLILVASYFLGFNPLNMISGGDVGGPLPSQEQGQQEGMPGLPNEGSTLNPQTKKVVLQVLGSTERRWTEMFAAEGQRYRPTTLVFYEGGTQSGCGAAQSAMGPFYCPADEKIYLDVSFFDDLATRFGAKGDFAAAYVIAHEVGHHVQKLTGTAEQVQRAQSRLSQVEGNRYQVAMELQADCYAGVWARRDTNLMEEGDLEEGLNTAYAIGDDILQKRSQGVVVPESFTHGSAEQRMTWLKRGLASGNPDQCDTFK